MPMRATILAAALASGAAFAPASSFGGLRLARPAVAAETAGRAAAALRPHAASRSRGATMQLGINDKSAGTSVDEFKKDGKVRAGVDGAGGGGSGGVRGAYAVLTWRACVPRCRVRRC